MRSFEEHPRESDFCHKCESFLGWNVKFRRAEMFGNDAYPSREHLRWTCRQCDYAIETQCADAPELVGAS